MQVFYVESGRREPIVGVVGALQFDVITSRLRTEYGVEIQVDPSTFTAARWIADPSKPLPLLGGATTAAVDRQGRRVLAVRERMGSAVLRKAEPDVRPPGRIARRVTTNAEPRTSNVYRRRPFHSSAVISQISAGNRPLT